MGGVMSKRQPIENKYPIEIMLAGGWLRRDISRAQQRLKGWQKVTDKMHGGLPVSGYNAQPTVAVDLVNDNKRMEEEILRALDSLANAPEIDKRWLAIGRTHMETAWMCINRSIFKPSRVKLEGDE